jgi:hypothetical protein
MCPRVPVAKVLTAVFLMIATSSGAQSRATTADLTGVVTDRTGGVLIGASVSAIHSDTNAVRRTLTAENGRFVLPALPPGVYSVRVEHAGFSPLLVEQVALNLGAALDLPITLELAGVRETLTIVPVARTRNLERTGVSSVIEQQQIESLPINGRNFISFSLLTTGTATDRTPQQGVSQTTGVTFSGQHARSNNITIDGLDNNDLIIGGIREAFSQEAVQEFQVLTNAYSAEFGKASGGVVNIVTKAGTNDARGTAFLFLRDETLNAKAYFERFDAAGNALDRPKAPYDQKQFGATVGGPVSRDRLFFFGSFERLDIQASNFVTIDDRTVVMHPFLGTPLGTPAHILRDAGFTVDVGHVPFAVRSTQGLGKLTYQLTSNERLEARVNWTNGLDENVEPFGGIVARSRAGASTTKNRSVTGSLTSVLSTTALNEVRVQLVDYDVYLNSLDPNCNGPCLREDQGGPNVEVTGVAGLGRQRTTPLVRESLRTQVVDTFSAYRGNHELKAGVDFSDVRFQRYALPLSFGARFIFGPLPATPGQLPGPVSAIQAVALGFPSAYVQGYGQSSISFGYRDLSLFAQDNWRLAETLTMKLGVRYQTQFWEDDEYVVPGYPGSYHFPQDRNNIAPRLALSWRPDDGGTSLHAAYGMFFDNTIAALRTVPSVIDGSNGVRTLALRFPRSVEAWNAPNRQLPESAVSPFPSVVITVDPSLATPYAHHLTGGVTRELRDGLSASVNALFVRGFNLLGTIDYNPVIPSLGAGRRPLDAGGVAGTSAPVLQYSSFGETWYKALSVVVDKRSNGRYQVQAAYTLSKAEDTATDFQTAFIVQDSGLGRNGQDPDGLPIGFDRYADLGPANHDQRHRLVVNGAYRLPGAFQASAILAIGSGRPYNILAGADLNGDGDGGAFPSDRARRDPADGSTSVPRNSGTMPMQATLDARVGRTFPVGGSRAIDLFVEAFNLLNRVNFTEANNIFGRGAYPTAPVTTFGRFEQAGAPRQVQLAARIRF